MEKTIQTLIEFIPEKIQFIGSKEESLCEDINYEIYERETEELVGVCTLDETGLLKEYHCVNHYEDGNIKRKEVPAIAEKFIRTFYPDGLNIYKLQSVIDLDNAYVLHYGIEDEKYGIDIPHIGISISIATTGQVVQFTLDNDPYDIIYPKHILSAKEAKERYLYELDFELIIRHADNEIYENGDNDYHLVYRILESARDIPANGDEPSTIEESNEMNQINERIVSNQTIHEMIGITEAYRKMGEQTVEQKKVEIWAHESVDTPAEIDYEEEFLEGFIRVFFHKKDDMLLFVHNGETMKIKEDMELAFSLEYDEDDSRKMNLTYLPSFPQTTGHVQMIEALTGKAYFVGVRDSKFF